MGTFAPGLRCGKTATQAELFTAHSCYRNSSLLYPEAKLAVCLGIVNIRNVGGGANKIWLQQFILACVILPALGIASLVYGLFCRYMYCLPAALGQRGPHG
jgi:hypothetical protein